MISVADYIFISASIGTAQEQGDDMALRVLSMRDELDRSDIPEANFSLIQFRTFIDATYFELVASHVGIPREMLDMVKELQSHVSHHYGPVNDFLSSNNITVNQDFADISALAGYEIDSANIE